MTKMSPFILHAFTIMPVLDSRNLVKSSNKLTLYNVLEGVS